MFDSLEARKEVVASLATVLDDERRFPEFVFLGEWGDSFIFDPDWMFDGSFARVMTDILAIEGSDCARLVNLDLPQGANREFCIDACTTPQDYQRRLQGQGPSDGWVYDLGRFACTSSLGLWCIYCERQSELAVVGFRKNAPLDRYGAFLSSVRASPVALALAGNADFAIRDSTISPEWKSLILQRYG